jgi:hypothetical protein
MAAARYYGLTAIKSGKQVNVTPLHRGGGDVPPCGKESCKMSLEFTVFNRCTLPSLAAT